MRIVHFTMAGKPLAKGRLRYTRDGHGYTPARTVAYESQLALAAQAAMDGRPPADGALAVMLDVRLPIAQSWSGLKKLAAAAGEVRPVGRPDLDNFAKMLDALNNIVWYDDSQVVEIHVVKWYSGSPGLEITVDSIE